VNASDKNPTRSPPTESLRSPPSEFLHSPPAESPRRPPFQFSLMGLMIVMFVVGAAAAPGYYMFRSGGEPRDSWLIGMLMILAGPLLIMTLISIVVALAGRSRRG
jgi:hypothetical protein